MLIRRMCEAGARTLPYMIVLLVPVLLSMPVLYRWARPEAAHDAVIREQGGVSERAGCGLARSIFYFLVWTFYAWRLSKWSAEQDAPEMSD